MADDITFEVIQVPGSQGTVVNDLNADGDHTGVFLDLDGAIQSYICREGQCTELSIPEALTLFAHGLCTDRTVVGDFLTEEERYRGFSVSSDGSAELFDHPQAISTYVTDCEEGRILGIVDTDRGRRVGFLRLDDDCFQDLAFGDDFDRPDSTLLNGMNARGHIAGCLVGPGTEAENTGGSAVSIYRDDHGWHQIPVPDEVFDSKATDIGPDGAVIGQWFDHNSNGPFGYIYQNGQFRRLSVPDSTATGPLTINAHGTIAGFFDDTDGNRRGFLARPRTD